MTEIPLVSICIPTYNGAKYIQKCLSSCLAQTYKNIEIVICDDCSTDPTVNLLNTLAQTDSRINVFQNTKNLGLVGNWNTTLNHASGEYIKWLFQDDWLEPDAIEAFVTIALQGYHFICSKRQFVLESTATAEEKKYYTQEVKKLEDHFPKEEEGHYFSPAQLAAYTTQYIALNFMAEPSLIFFKKDLIKQVGYYDPLLFQICDLEYNIRLGAETGVYVINKPLCHFAIHSNSTTSQNIHQKFFQLRFIEQSYYAYKLVKSPDFVHLRQYLTIPQVLKLQVYYKYRIHEAKRFIQKQAPADYQSQLAKYPFLSQSWLERVLLFPLFKSIDILKARH